MEESDDYDDLEESRGEAGDKDTGSMGLLVYEPPRVSGANNQPSGSSKLLIETGEEENLDCKET